MIGDLAPVNVFSGLEDQSTSEPASLDEAARQFEGMMMKMMIKEMRKSIPAWEVGSSSFNILSILSIWASMLSCAGRGGPSRPRRGAGSSSSLSFDALTIRINSSRSPATKASIAAERSSSLNAANMSARFLAGTDRIGSGSSAIPRCSAGWSYWAILIGAPGFSRGTLSIPLYA